MFNFYRRCLTFALSFALLGIVVACSVPRADDIDKAAEPWLLRSYPVSTMQGPEVRSILVKLIPEGDKGGRVAFSPNGQLLVSAPEGFHTGVEVFLKTLQATPPTPPPTVRIDYWVLIGRASEAFDAIGVDVAIRDNVAQLASAIGVPAMQFKQLEALSLVSTSGDRASIDGARVQIRQEATALDKDVLADVRIQPVGPGNTFSTRVHVPLGKVLMLGQAGLVVDPRIDAFTGKPPASASSSDVSVFYLLKAQRL